MAAPPVHFARCHFVVRNDGSRERSVHFDVFTSKAEAIDSAIELIETLEENLPLTQKVKDCAHLALQNGERIWVWEWEKKGNGDSIWIQETIHPELYTSVFEDFVNEELSGKLGFVLTMELDKTSKTLKELMDPSHPHSALFSL